MNTKMKEMLAEVVSGEQLMKMQALFELRKEFLEAVFSAIDEKYGDVDTFMAKEFGLTAEKRTQRQLIHSFFSKIGREFSKFVHSNRPLTNKII